MAKLDTELDTPLLRQEYFEQKPASGRLDVGADDSLRLVVPTFW